MKFKTMVGQYFQVQHSLVIAVKNYSTSVTINYGDILIIDTSNNDSTQSLMAVARTGSADSTLVVGVCCQVGGLAPLAMGDMCVYGFADVNVVSGSYSAGAYLGTSTTSGSAATGTYANGSALGKVLYNAGGTVTTTVAQICLH